MSGADTVRSPLPCGGLKPHETAQVAAHFPQERNNPVGIDFVVRACFFIACECVKTAWMTKFVHGHLYAADEELHSRRALKPKPERLKYCPAGVTTQMLFAVWM